MTTLDKIKKELSSPNIDKKINKIINCGDPQPLKDMVLLAEYFQEKHKRGYVVYWTTAGVSRFEVDTYEDWIKQENKSWIGPVHWHTSLCKN